MLFVPSTHKGREHTGRTLGECVGIQDEVGLFPVSETNPWWDGNASFRSDFSVINQQSLLYTIYLLGLFDSEAIVKLVKDHAVILPSCGWHVSREHTGHMPRHE